MKPAAPQNSGIGGGVAATRGQGAEAPRGAFRGVKGWGKRDGGDAVLDPSPVTPPMVVFFFCVWGGISPKEKPKKALAATRTRGGDILLGSARCWGTRGGLYPLCGHRGMHFGGKPSCPSASQGGSSVPEPCPAGGGMPASNTDADWRCSGWDKGGFSSPGWWREGREGVEGLGATTASVPYEKKTKEK